MSDSGLLAGRYRMLERRDPTGTSWRSRDELLHRDVTISEVRLPPPGPYRDRLLGQIRATAGLRHPGITALHDVVSTPDRMWLVLESVEGRSLLQTVRADGPFAPERAAEIGLRVLDALAAAHERGVHLAATPDAVLLTPGGRVVLTGIASPVPPDELRDLGVTLFAAVEGRMPDTGPHAGLRMADGTPLADPVTGSTRSGPLTPLLDELLATEPVRHPDATSVRLTLERIAPRPARQGPRRGPLVVAAAVTAVLVLGGATFWLWPRSADLTLPAMEPTPMAEPASFRAIPRPCGLLSKEQLEKLYLKTANPFTETSTKCGWGAANDGQPENLNHLISYEIAIFPTQNDEPGRQRAHKAFTDRLASARLSTGTDTAGATRTPPAPVRGVGQEAYTGTLDTSEEHAVAVVVRVSNLLVSIEYQRGAGPNSSGQTEKGAIDAAKWIAEALARQR